MKLLLSIVSALFVFAIAPAANASTVDNPVKVVTAASGITYATGGVGQDSRDKIDELARTGGFNVKLTFAWDKGNFVAGIPVTIHDASGSKVFDLRSSDPLLILRMPAGRYTVAAMYDKKVVERTIDVRAAGLEIVHFSWPQPQDSRGIAAR